MLSRTFALLEALSMVSLAIGSILVPALIALGGVSAALIGAGALLPALALLRFKTLRTIDSEATVPIVEIGLLRSLNILAPLPAPVLEGLARSLVAERFAAGSVVVREGEPGGSFYAIADGEIEASADGRTLNICRRGEGVGEIALLRDVPRTATLTARTDALLYRLDKEAFLIAVTGHAPAGDAADSVVEERLARGASRLLDADDHRVGPDQVLDVALAEAGLLHPAAAVGAGVVEAAGRLDQHVEAHQQAERVLRRSSSMIASKTISAPPSGSAS